MPESKEMAIFIRVVKMNLDFPFLRFTPFREDGNLPEALFFDFLGCGKNRIFICCLWKFYLIEK
jgi:hypothetical protein